MQSVSTERRFADWVREAAGLEDARLGALLAGGNSNVTRLVETRQGRFVLRHPPVHVVSDKAAAGVAREYKVIKALEGRAPVPAAIAWCDDPDVLGQPFALTGWIDGVALSETVPANYAGIPDAVDQLGLEMMRGLAAVHSVNWQEILPADFGRPDSFVTRQIDRWVAVREKSAVRELPLLGELAQWLRDNQPPPGPASVIHCDFHLDNCLVARDRPELLAILDWEMATIGNPLIDVGLCLFFWRRDPARALGFPAVQALSNRPDAIAPEALADAWSERTGFDHGNLSYYMAFMAWRLAAIVEGAWVLHRQGHQDTAYARGLEHTVPNLLAEAAEIVERGKC